MSVPVQSPRVAVRNALDKHGTREAIHIPLTACSGYSAKSISVTYQTLNDAIDSATATWQDSGVNGRIALVLENRIEFFVHWLALNALGVSVIPINHEMLDSEIPYYFEHGEAQAVITLTEYRDRMQRISAGLGTPIPVVTPQDIHTLNFGPPCSVVEPHADTECALLYTSGSTGKPKGCMLSNDYFIQQGLWYQKLDGHISLQEGQERLLTPLPLSHMNAMSVSTMAMFMSGGCLIQLDRFHPSTWWQSVRDSGATALHYLGVLPAILLALPPTKNDDFSGQVRFGFGAGVNPTHHENFERRFGFPLIEAWAMTECGAGGAIIANLEPRRVGTCCFGKPSPEVEWQLVDEHKQPVATGVPGELRVRAAGSDPRRGFFSGYLKNPEATAEIWQDGWLNTGDVVVELDNGSLAFVDRRKNIIRRSGENISALEVEAAVSTHPAIQTAVATAVPDEIRGDEVALCVMLNTGFVASRDLALDIQHSALEQLVYFKAPGWLIFCETIPVTASNKPKRADIKILARNLLEAGDAFDLRQLKKRIKSG